MGFFSGLGSALAGGAFSLLGGSQQASSAKQLAANNNSMSIELANTAHQREVKDLLAAGLNPMLSAGGSGASMPTLSIPPVNNPLGDAVSTASSLYQKNKEREAIDANISNTEQNTRQSAAQTSAALSQMKLNLAAIDKVKAETALTTNSALNSKLNNALLAMSLPAASNESRYQQDVGKAAPWARNAVNMLKDIFGTFNSAKSLTTR